MKEFAYDGDIILESDALEPGGWDRVIAGLQSYYRDRPWSVSRLGLMAGLYSDDLNKEIARRGLARERWPCRVVDQTFEAYDRHRDRPGPMFEYAQHRMTSRGKRIRNDKKVRLASEVSIGSGHTVIQRTDYISSLMTDQTAFRRIEWANSGHVLSDGMSTFLREEQDGFALRELDEACGVSNQLGASTLAFSTDGRLMLVWQTHDNAQSSGLLAPSGSGSLDWADVEGEDGTDLMAIAASGAARELVEECGLEKVPGDETSIRVTEVSRHRLLPYGFTRMIHRAGKPEFLFISVLPFDRAQIDAALLTKKERAFTLKTERAEGEALDFTAAPSELRAQIIRLCDRFLEPGMVARLQVTPQIRGLSFPLYEGLRALRRTIEGDMGDSVARWLIETAARERPWAG